MTEPILIPALQFEKRAAVIKARLMLGSASIAADLARVRGYEPMPDWADARAGGWFLLVDEARFDDALALIEGAMTGTG